MVRLILSIIQDMMQHIHKRKDDAFNYRTDHGKDESCTDSMPHSSRRSTINFTDFWVELSFEIWVWNFLCKYIFVYE